MKNIINLFSLLILLIFFSCDPPRVSLTDSVKLKATISNTNESILLGDTLKIRLVLPDTIITENNEKIIVTSLQKAEFSASISKLDTITRSPIYLAPPDYFTTEGSISSSNNRYFILSNTAKPFAVTFKVVPKQKGIYRIEVSSQTAEMKINGNNQPIGLITGFDVINSHYMLLNPYYPEIVSDSNNIKQRGFGYYWFRVN